MSLEQKVMDELKNAMRAKDEAALRSLRAIKAAIIIEKTAEGANGEISEATELKMLQKMAKQRRDSLDIFMKQNREDLAAKEREELRLYVSVVKEIAFFIVRSLYLCLSHFSL